MTDWATLAFSSIPTSSSDSTVAAWNAAECDWSADGYRLPTEAEWEYLARGGSALSTDKWSGTDDEAQLKNYAWYSANASSMTHAVKIKYPNDLLLYDMSGNVNEWCWDWYGSIGADTPATGNPGSGVRMYRGGDFYCIAVNVMVAADRTDTYKQPYNHDKYVGFRVVRTAP